MSLATAKLRERTQFRLSVLPPASPPPFMFQEHPFGGLPSCPPGSPDPVIDSLTELERVGVLGHGADGTVYKARHRRTGAELVVKSLRVRGDGGAALVAATGPGSGSEPAEDAAAALERSWGVRTGVHAGRTSSRVTGRV